MFERFDLQMVETAEATIRVRHGGSDHRSQICTILTTLGVTIPPMGLWDYAEASNRARQRDIQPAEEVAGR